MLSTISSFLPPVLQLDRNTNPPVERETTILDRPQLTEEPKRNMTVDEHGVKKRKERTNEVCSGTCDS